MGYRQADPYCIQIEPTEGCNLRCGFCGIRGIREKGPREDLSGPYSFMAVSTARSIARQMARAGWNSRLELAMHGEPTKHPDLPSLVAALREPLPKASILLTTNGIPLLDGPWGTGSLKSALLALFSAGVNTIAIDDYKPHRVAPAIRELDLRVPVIEYPSDNRGNPHVRHHGYRLVIVEDISDASSGTHATLSNHAGAAAPKDRRFNDRVCTLPFRELSVRWDGSIALCCNDWRGEFRLGDAADLVATWHSRAAYAARRVLLAEGRDNINPCDGCDYRGTRVGLLPKSAEVGLPTEEDRAAIRDAYAHGTLSPVVLRRWEPSLTAGASSVPAGARG